MMASRERDSRRKGKFTYSIFWCFSSTLFLHEGSLHFHFALGHCDLCTQPSSPKISLLHLTYCLLPQSPLDLKTVEEVPKLCICTILFSLFFFLNKWQRIPASIVKRTVLQPIPLHTAPFTLVLVRDLHLNLSFHLNHEIFTFFTSPVQFTHTYTVNFNMYK